MSAACPRRDTVAGEDARRRSGVRPQRHRQGWRPRVTAPWAEVRHRLNVTLRGWQNYFRQGSVSRAYTIVNRYVEQRVRSFLEHLEK